MDPTLDWCEADLVIYQKQVGKRHLERRCQVLVNGEAPQLNCYWADHGEPVMDGPDTHSAEESGILTLICLMVQKAMAIKGEDVREFISAGCSSLAALTNYIVSAVGNAVYGEMVVLKVKLSMA